MYNCVQLYYSQNQFNAPLNMENIHPALVDKYLRSLAILQHYILDLDLAQREKKETTADQHN